MKKVNYVHLAGGGWAAGFLFNLLNLMGWLTTMQQQWLHEFGRALPSRAPMTAMFVGYAFGFIAVAGSVFLVSRGREWLGCAVVSAASLWFLSLALPSLLIWGHGLVSTWWALESGVFSAGNLIVATIAGSWVYKWGESQKKAIAAA